MIQPGERQTDPWLQANLSTECERSKAQTQSISHKMSFFRRSSLSSLLASIRATFLSSLSAAYAPVSSVLSIQLSSVHAEFTSLWESCRVTSKKYPQLVTTWAATKSVYLFFFGLFNLGAFPPRVSFNKEIRTKAFWSENSCKQIFSSRKLDSIYHRGNGL